jgi:hypothetical protein
MSFSMPIQWFHSHEDPIWPDGTFNTMQDLLSGLTRERLEQLGWLLDKAQPRYKHITTQWQYPVHFIFKDYVCIYYVTMCTYTVLFFLCVLLVIDHIQQPNYAILSPKQFYMPSGIFVLGGYVEETHRKNEKERHLLTEDGGGGSQILRQRETLTFYKSFNTLWLPASFPLYRCIAMSIY